MLGRAVCGLILIALTTGSTACAKPRLAFATNWVGSWASSQQIPEPRNALAPEDLKDATLRQIVHLTLGGKTLRVRLSNAFGTEPLHITAVHIARPLSLLTGSIEGPSDTALTFAGSADVTIPAGAEYVSDPIAFAAPPFSDLAITMHIEDPPAQQTSHPGARETSFLVHGDMAGAIDLMDAKQFEHWYFLSGVEVETSPDAKAIVTLGDSITDGHAATTNGNDRWPDDLARRLAGEPATRDIGVLNVGTGGNRLLLDGLGPNALAREDRDVLARPGVRYLIVLEGINDLGTLTRDAEVPAADHDALTARIIGAYRQIILRAHGEGIKAMGATITPDGGSALYHPGALDEAARQALNEWIRAPGHFDAVADFDAAVRDPAHPDKLLPAFDSGDHLHPSPAGYRAMANVVPLAFFASSYAKFAKTAHPKRTAH
jgi:lysophospholipase L1-like esterase